MMPVLLTKKQLEDASRCGEFESCADCSCYVNCKKHVCTEELLAQTALALYEMVIKMQWKGIHSWNYQERGCPMCGGTQFMGHEPACELANLLKKMEG